jgi:hypothetical protein
VPLTGARPAAVARPRQAGLEVGEQREVALAVGRGGRVRDGHACSSSVREDRDERLAERHPVARREVQARDDAVVRRGDRELHLHRLQHEEDVPGGHRVAVGDVDEQDGPRHGRVERPGQRAGARAGAAPRATSRWWPSRAIHTASSSDRHRVAAPHAVQRDPRLAGSEPSGPAAVHVRAPTDTEPAPTRASPWSSSARARGPRARACPRRRASRPGRGRGRVERQVGEHALEQAGVLPAGAHVVAGEQRAGERGVRRHAGDGEGGQRAVQAVQGGGAVGAVGDDLREHRVVRRPDDAAGPHAGVDPHAGPVGSR